MKTHQIGQFDHLGTFGIAGALVPSREAGDLLDARLQLEVIEEMLREGEPAGRSLAELREPDLGRVNYTEEVRAGIEAIWRPIVDRPLELPPPRLLERLNIAWSKAEKVIGGEALPKSAQIFADRALKKARIIEEEAERLAAEQGLPAASKWLEGRKVECDALHKIRAQELVGYGNRKKRQSDALDETKEDWTRLLGEEEFDPKGVARRFLLLAGGLLIIAVGLWILSIPINSLGGLAGAALFFLLAFLAARPIFLHLRRSSRIERTAGKLSVGYKSLSLLGLDERAKRQEMEYCLTLRTHIARIQQGGQERMGLLEGRKGELASRRDAAQTALRIGAPTIRPLLWEGAMEEWYQRGRAYAPLGEWKSRIVSLNQPPAWEAIDREARSSISFLREIRAEEELYRIYPAKEDRMAFLQTLREAAIGRNPGEAFLSLNFAETGGRAPQAYLLVEIEDPENSKLAKEINQEWGGAGVGVAIVQASDPAEIVLCGLVYGYPLAAIKEWEEVEASFARVKEKEGEAIYPVLFPKKDEGNT